MYLAFIIFNLPNDGNLNCDGNVTTYTFDVLVWQWSKVANEARPLVRDFLGGMFVNSYDERF